MRTKYKAWTEPYLDKHKEVSLPYEELENLKGYILEVGSGKGGFLLQMAQKFPQETFIGVERNVTCAGITAKKLVENEVGNAKIFHQNIDVLFEYIKPNSTKCIFLNFSDPWPKKRHEKRRLTSPKYLEKFYSLLEDGGRLYFKTDNDDLYAYTLEILQNCPFKMVENIENYAEPALFDAPTEYELSFRKIGKSIHRIVLEK